MYTVNILNKELDKANQRLYVLTEFLKDGVKSFERAFSFAPNATLEDIKRTLNDYVAELESADTNVVSIPTGAIDYTTAVPRTDPAERAWHDNYEKLKRVQELVTLGVLTGNEAKVVALRDKVKADFRAEYIKLI